MPYHYTDQSRESDPHALPDVETVFSDFGECGCGSGLTLLGGTAYVECECGDTFRASDKGWFYAYGFPGCMWDSDPVGPFDTEAEALEAAREGVES